MKHKTKWAIAAVVILISAALVYGVLQNDSEIVQEESHFTDEYRERRIDEIISDPDFQQRVRQEAEKRYYLEVMKEADEKLQELQEGGFRGDETSALQDYLWVYGRELTPYADEIVKLPRWIEVMGIIGTETTFCKEGVGSAQNNCGAIQAAGKFRTYGTKLESIKAVAALLERPLYKGRSIADINGTYCVDESRPENKCKGWTESIQKIVAEIRTLLA